MPGISKQKARKILKDGKVRGKRLTPKQRRYMGARSSGDTAKEAVRQATS